MRIAYEHGFPVPEPVFEYEPDDGAGTGFVTAFVGETMPKRLLTGAELAETRPILAEQAGRLLAVLHAIPAGECALLDSCPTAPTRSPLIATVSTITTRPIRRSSWGCAGSSATTRHRAGACWSMAISAWAT